MENEYNLIQNESAIIIVDIQNSFCHSDRNIGRNGYDVSMMRGTIPHVKELVEKCRDADILDIRVTQNHYSDDITKKSHRISKMYPIEKTL